MAYERWFEVGLFDKQNKDLKITDHYLNEIDFIIQKINAPLPKVLQIRIPREKTDP